LIPYLLFQRILWWLWRIVFLRWQNLLYRLLMLLFAAILRACNRNHELQSLLVSPMAMLFAVYDRDCKPSILQQKAAWVDDTKDSATGEILFATITTRCVETTNTVSTFSIMHFNRLFHIRKKTTSPTSRKRPEFGIFGNRLMRRKCVGKIPEKSLNFFSATVLWPDQALCTVIASSMAKTVIQS